MARQRGRDRGATDDSVPSTPDLSKASSSGRKELPTPPEPDSTEIFNESEEQSGKFLIASITSR
ncbi:UNVERIFIED_CONTAM: hypothetical protein Sradi_2154700 [Sesamum radiatum]|uniref:Uncharacterized protein n=1 Tax=Sesamum radiatum TaxID=300843 RepID=A0AAW2T0J2_SESRA